MIRRLQVKLILAAMLSLSIVLAAVLSIASILNYRQIVQNADIILSVLEKNNAQFPDSGFPAEDYPSGGRLNSPELPFESRYFSVLVSQAGEVLSANIGKIAAIDQETAESYALTVLQSGKKRGFLGNYRYAVSQISSDAHIIFLDCGRSLYSFHDFARNCLGVTGAGLLAVLALLVLISGRIVHPFSESYEKQKRFITDAGHELKTPLAIIDVNAEALRLEQGDNEWLQAIQSQTKRLSELTGKLILLARMEEARPQLQWVVFPLSDVVEDTAAAFQPLAKSKQKTLQTQIHPGLSLRGDPGAIEQLVTILLDNAVKYADEGGDIGLSLEKIRGSVRLVVRNPASGISRETIEHLFDRFYRGDPSRNSEVGGYGLGTAIAYAIVNSHKGRITASCPDGHTLKITATFPA